MWDVRGAVHAVHSYDIGAAGPLEKQRHDVWLHRHLLANRTWNSTVSPGDNSYVRSHPRHSVFVLSVLPSQDWFTSFDPTCVWWDHMFLVIYLLFFLVYSIMTGENIVSTLARTVSWNPWGCFVRCAACSAPSLVEVKPLRPRASQANCTRWSLSGNKAHRQSLWKINTIRYRCWSMISSLLSIWYIYR